MTKQHRINELTKKQILLTYDEWYALNELAFITPNKYNPTDLYEEYVNETLEKYKNIGA